jgi:membrane protease subunit (stomatin/prohibitin family)
MLEIQTATSQVAAPDTGQQQFALEESRHSSLNMPPYQPQRLDPLRSPDVCQTCGVANFCPYCGVRTYKCQPQYSYDNCAECGAANFCFSCGRPTTMMNRTTAVQAASFVDVSHASMQGDSWTSLNPIMTGQCVQTDNCGAVAVCIPVAMIPIHQGFPILVGA